jgi:hypothetical protein
LALISLRKKSADTTGGLSRGQCALAATSGATTPAAARSDHWRGESDLANAESDSATYLLETGYGQSDRLDGQSELLRHGSELLRGLREPLRCVCELLRIGAKHARRVPKHMRRGCERRALSPEPLRKCPETPAQVSLDRWRVNLSGCATSRNSCIARRSTSSRWLNTRVVPRRGRLTSRAGGRYPPPSGSDDRASRVARVRLAGSSR